METTDHPGTVRRYGRYTAQERARHLMAWKRSGQSALNYGQTHGIRAGSLYRWNRKGLGGHGAGALRTDSPFIPVSLSGAVCPSPILPQVTLRSGKFECLLDGGADMDALVTLAKRLKQEVFDV
jgi:hypothetical protein